MNAHPHADLMLEYAYDATKTDKPWKLGEYRSEGEEPWQDLHDCSPGWRAENEYRRKPRILSINGFEFPEPCRDTPALDSTYYIPWLTPDWKVRSLAWRGQSTDLHYLEIGFVHLTEEAATRHADAILSATK